MAGLGRKDFQAGAVLSAADVDGYLMDQSVMVFATSAAAGSAIGTAVSEGMVRYLKATDSNDTANQMDFYNGSAWESVRHPDVAGKNKIINGGFDIWQRGTSFSNPADGSYTVDRWVNFRDGSGATTAISQQTFTPGTAPVAGYESAYYLRYAVTVAGSSNTYRILDHRIEDVRTFAGQTVTFSFFAKADSARTITATPIQSFGSGGSGDVAATTTSFTMSTSWQRFTGTVNIPSIAGKTIGTGHFLYLRLNLPAGVTMTTDIWGVQLEAGSVATPFSRAGGTLQGELAACQRYYQRLTTGGNANAYFGNGWTTSSVNANCFFPTKVTMRVVPTSSEVGGNILVQDTTNAGYGASSASIITSQSTQDLIAISIGISGATAGRACVWGANANASSYFAVSAEL